MPAADRPEAGLLIGADGAAIVGMRVDDDARRAFLEQLLDELAQDCRAVARTDQLRRADREIDAQRAEGLVGVGMVVLQMRVIALQIGDRPAVETQGQPFQPAHARCSGKAFAKQQFCMWM